MSKTIKLWGAALLALVGLNQAAQAEAAPPVIRIGLALAKSGSPPAFTAGPIGVAYTKGWVDEEFRKDGVKVEWVFFKGQGPAVNEALTNNQLDLAFQGDVPSLVGRSVGLKTRLIASAGTRSNLYVAVPAGSPVKSIQDLKGKKIGLSVGTSIQGPVDRYLAANGLSERDFRVVNLDLASTDAALASKSIDAAFGYLNLLTLQQRGLARVIYSSTSEGDSSPYSGSSGLLVTDAFASRYPQTTTRVLKAVLKGHRWSSDPANQAEKVKLWGRMGYPEPVLKAELAHQDPHALASPLLDDYTLNRYQQVADQAYQLKLARAKVDVKKWADRSFLDAALKASALERFWTPLNAQGKPVALK